VMTGAALPIAAAERQGGASRHYGCVGKDDNHQRWAPDADLLREIGRHLSPQKLHIEVRLPRSVADRAVTAWQSEDDGGRFTQETPHESIVRDQAASLALIGLAIEDTGMEDGDDVVFKLDAWLIGNALNAADEVGLLDP
jgi:hypothetical protein